MQDLKVTKCLTPDSNGHPGNGRGSQGGEGANAAPSDLITIIRNNIENKPCLNGKHLVNVIGYQNMQINIQSFRRLAKKSLNKYFGKSVLYSNIDYESNFDEYKTLQWRSEAKEFYSPRPRILSTVAGLLNYLQNNKYFSMDLETDMRLNFQSVVLDTGTRDGYLIDVLESIGFNNVVGIEFLNDYVDYAKTKQRNVCLGDVHDIPFDDETFDLIVCRHVLEHTIDPIKVLSELTRVGVKGSIIFISFPLEYIPKGKHTIAIPTTKAITKLIKDSYINVKIVYLGASEDLYIIPDGKEITIILEKIA